jgi:hypothetical protein
MYPTPIPKTLYIMYHGPNWQSNGRMVLTTGRLYNTKAWPPLSPVKVQPSQSPGSTPPSRQDYTIATMVLLCVRSMPESSVGGGSYPKMCHAVAIVPDPPASRDPLTRSPKLHAYPEGCLAGERLLLVKSPHNTADRRRRRRGRYYLGLVNYSRRGGLKEESKDDRT